jgi:hypothetical protein
MDDPVTRFKLDVASELDSESQDLWCQTSPDSRRSYSVELGLHDLEQWLQVFIH